MAYIVLNQAKYLAYKLKQIDVKLLGIVIALLNFLCYHFRLNYEIFKAILCQ